MRTFKGFIPLVTCIVQAATIVISVVTENHAQMPVSFRNYSFMDMYVQINSATGSFFTSLFPMLLALFLICSMGENIHELFCYGSRKRMYSVTSRRIAAYSCIYVLADIISTGVISVIYKKPFCNWLDPGSYYTMVTGEVNRYAALIFIVQTMLLIIRALTYGNLLYSASGRIRIAAFCVCATLGVLDFLHLPIPLLSGISSLDYSFWRSSGLIRSARIGLCMVIYVVSLNMAYRQNIRKEYY